jgi:adenylyltransferase/sulfurtransferase
MAKDLNPEELHGLLQAKGPREFRLIDVREEDEFAICKLPEAELIPLSRFVEESSARLANQDQHIVVYCHHGMRSSNAADWLRAQGYSNVSNLTGGIDAWAERIDPEMNRY